MSAQSVGGLGRSEPQLGRREQRCPSRRMAKRHGDAVAKRSGAPLPCLPRPINSPFARSCALAAVLAGPWSSELTAGWCTGGGLPGARNEHRAGAVRRLTLSLLGYLSPNLSARRPAGACWRCVLTTWDALGQNGGALQSLEESAQRGGDDANQPESSASKLGPVLRGMSSCGVNLNQGFVVSAENSSVVVLLLTVPDAAKRLGVCRRSLERLIADGVFPRPVKLGRSSRVPVTDVERFVESLTRERAS